MFGVLGMDGTEALNRAAVDKMEFLTVEENHNTCVAICGGKAVIMDVPPALALLKDAGDQAGTKDSAIAKASLFAALGLQKYVNYSGRSCADGARGTCPSGLPFSAAAGNGCGGLWL